MLQYRLGYILALKDKKLCRQECVVFHSTLLYCWLKSLFGIEAPFEGFCIPLWGSCVISFPEKAVIQVAFTVQSDFSCCGQLSPS